MRFERQELIPFLVHALMLLHLHLKVLGRCLASGLINPKVGPMLVGYKSNVAGPGQITRAVQDGVVSLPLLLLGPVGRRVEDHSLLPAVRRLVHALEV